MTNVMTAKGHEMLKRKLASLKKKKSHLVQEMELARQEGDLAENSAYHQLRETVAVVNQQVEELERQLYGVKIVRNGRGDRVSIGTRVTVKVNGRQRILDIVGDGESDPLRGRISHRSPLGKRLMGKAIGDIIRVETPRGISEYLIAHIEAIG